MDFRYLYTSFEGRINRKPFWIAGLILLIGPHGRVQFDC